MRIIAGTAKGKTLYSPSHKTRPTSDRAREGLFSSLESEFGTISDLKFLDLFSGSGAVGIEALSRGAALVHAVEKDPDAYAICTKNFGLVPGTTGKYHIYKMAAMGFVETKAQNQYDIIFMDPPYELSNETIERFLMLIHEKKLLTPSGVVAIERAAKGDPFSWPAPFRQEKIRSYGQGSIFYGGYSASVLP